MSWLMDKLNSSIGKKFIMAFTGLLLIAFLVIHLLNNLLLFLGPEIFNSNVERLEAVKPIVRVIELLLLLIFIFHIYNALRLWYQNKKANPIKYAVNISSKNSTIYSRTMVITGSIILIFLVLHLSTFWWSYNFNQHPVNDQYPFYSIIENAFANPLLSIFYVVAMIILGFHLNHAFQSAFQTFGWRHKKYTPLVEKLGTAIAIIMTIGFGSIPVFFYLASLGGN